MEIKINNRKKIQKFRLIDEIGKHKIHILVDSGCTHSFLDEDIIKKMKCQLEPIGKMVGHTVTCSQVICDKIFRGFTWEMQV